jgi:hypothetical protein
MTMSKISKSSAAMPQSVLKNPLPNLYSLFLNAKKMDRVDGPDTGKSEWIKL